MTLTFLWKDPPSRIPLLGMVNQQYIDMCLSDFCWMGYPCLRGVYASSCLVSLERNIIVYALSAQNTITNKQFQGG